MSVSLPTPGGQLYVTDGGLETDLIFNRGFELEEFAAFPLIYDEQGRTALADYYAGYADIARRAVSAWCWPRPRGGLTPIGLGGSATTPGPLIAPIEKRSHS